MTLGEIIVLYHLSDNSRSCVRGECASECVAGGFFCPGGNFDLISGIQKNSMLLWVELDAMPSFTYTEPAMTLISCYCKFPWQKKKGSIK